MSWGDLEWGETEWGGGASAPVVPPAPAALGRANATLAVDDELGIDVDVITDASPDFRLARGRRNLGNALARRLSTPRGGLWYDPDYGLDLREYLNASVTPSDLRTLPAEVEAECLKDPRVQACAVSVVFSMSTRRLRVRLTVTTALAPFRLVLAVDQLTVALLDAA